jgi:hypothetical protein
MPSEMTTVSDERDLPVMTKIRCLSTRKESVHGRRYPVRVERPQPRGKK